MSNLEPELDQLKQDLLDLTQLVITQLNKSMEAVYSYNLDLAKEVIADEKKVNASELKIDRNCEDILALYGPVAIDLRFVLASLKINHDLERMGDHAEGIAKCVNDIGGLVDPEILEKFKVPEMHQKAIAMLQDIHIALENDDTELARKTFKKDSFLNKATKKANKNAISYLMTNPEKAQVIIPLLAIIRKLERVGDLTKNLGEEIIFHIEAKVLKHKKDKKKGNKENKDSKPGDKGGDKN